MAQVWAKAFYNSKQWQKCREYILIRDGYMCQCHKILGGEPCGEPAFDVHHIVELTPQNISDPRIALREDNLLAVNDVHHREWLTIKSRDCAAGMCFDESGQVVPVSASSQVQ
jgi:hypothetical protein